MRDEDKEIRKREREWAGLEFTKFQRAVENTEKWKKTGCEVICGAPTTSAVKE